MAMRTKRGRIGREGAEICIVCRMWYRLKRCSRHLDAPKLWTGIGQVIIHIKTLMHILSKRPSAQIAG